jgi:tetratricopeptide (TPR) repeat protein
MREDERRAQEDLRLSHEAERVVLERKVVPAVAPLSPVTPVRARLPVDAATLRMAKDLHDRAWRDWTNGDAAKAVERLEQCVELADLPKCHRTLGSVYAQIGDTRRSVEQYRRYLELEPRALDAGRVREIIRDAEAAPVR